MAPYSSIPAWKIPWTEEPGRLQSMGSLRVRHDWTTSLSLFTFMHWRRKWQPTPVFLPGESQEWGILVGCHLWGLTELDTNEVTYQQLSSSMLVKLQCNYLVNSWSLPLDYENSYTKNPLFFFNFSYKQCHIWSSSIYILIVLCSSLAL